MTMKLGWRRHRSRPPMQGWRVAEASADVGSTEPRVRGSSDRGSRGRWHCHLLAVATETTKDIRGALAFGDAAQAALVKLPRVDLDQRCRRLKTRHQSSDRLSANNAEIIVRRESRALGSSFGARCGERRAAIFVRDRKGPIRLSARYIGVGGMRIGSVDTIRPVCRERDADLLRARES